MFLCSRAPEWSRAFLLFTAILIAFFLASRPAFAVFGDAGINGSLICELKDRSEKKKSDAAAAISGSRYPGVIEHLLQSPVPGDPSFGEGVVNIHINYPSIGNKTVDADIRQWVSGIAAAFETHLDATQIGSSGVDEIDSQIARYLQDDDLHSDYAFNDDGGKRTFELFGEYSVARPSPQALSVTFELWNYADNRRANLDIITLNYNLNNNQRLNFVDIFERPDVALDLMSKWSRERLVARGVGFSQMMKNGSEPLVENFSSLTLTPEGLTINFQPYQVAPWEAGIQKIEMPLEELLPAGPLLALWGI